MSTIDGRVTHIHLDLLTKELLTEIPYDRIFIHRHARVLRIIYQRIANSLHILAIGTHLVVGVNLSIDRVCTDVIGEHLERVSMHKERVTL